MPASRAPAGLLITHIFGAPADPRAWEEVAADAGIPLVFDAAHALGSRHRGTPIGGFGDAEVFSLSPTKPVIAGEGGLVATNRDDIAEAVRIGRDYGNPGDYDTRFVGPQRPHVGVPRGDRLESRSRSSTSTWRSGSCSPTATGSSSPTSPGSGCRRSADGDASTWKDFTDRGRRGRRSVARATQLVVALRADGDRHPVLLRSAGAPSAVARRRPPIGSFRSPTGSRRR